MTAIRAAEPRDASPLAALIATEVEQGVAHFGTVPPTVDEVARWIRTTGAHPFLVADVQGTAVGFARATPWKTREAYAWTVEVGVYLEPTHQGRGVGRQLVTGLLALLEERGFRMVVAGIALPNPGSVGLFASLGFVHVGTFPRMGFKHGGWHDVGYWSLHFGQGPPQ